MEYRCGEILGPTAAGERQLRTGDPTDTQTFVYTLHKTVAQPLVAIAQGQAKAEPRDLHGRSQQDIGRERQDQEQHERTAAKLIAEQMTPRTQKQRKWRKGIMPMTKSVAEVSHSHTPLQNEGRTSMHSKPARLSTSPFLGSPRGELWQAKVPFGSDNLWGILVLMLCGCVAASARFRPGYCGIVPAARSKRG